MNRRTLSMLEDVRQELASKLESAVLAEAPDAEDTADLFLGGEGNWWTKQGLEKQGLRRLIHRFLSGIAGDVPGIANVSQAWEKKLYAAISKELTRQKIPFVEDVRAAPLPAKTLALKLKFPAGFEVDAHGASWHKNGGYADTVFARVREAAEALGFKKSGSSDTSSPDGSRVGGGSALEDAQGNRLTFERSLGATKGSNRFSIYLTMGRGAK